MKAKLIIVACLVLAIALILPMACKKEAAPMPEPKGKILIGITDDFIGPLRGSNTAHADGQKDAMRYINEELGGIDGHTLEYIVIDHKSDAGLILSGWERMKNEGALIILSYLGTIPVLEKKCQEDGIILVGGWPTVDQGYPKGKSYFFAIGIHSPGAIFFGCNSIEEDWAKKGKTGTPKMAFDAIAFGSTKFQLSKAAKMDMAKRGWEYIITYTSPTPADVTTQVLQVKNFGADYLYIMGSEVAGILWFKELERQGFRPEVYGSSLLALPAIKDACGELIVGSKPYVQVPPWTDTDDPLISKLHELNAKWYPDVTWRSNYYIRGFVSFLATAEALKRAMNNVGYDNLDGDAIRVAMETINDFRPEGMRVGFTWTPTDHHGLHNLRFYTWNEDLILVPAGDWRYIEALPEEQREQSWWLKE
jgi:branched-chain amino acid transport system substrate-binding protein